MARVLAVVLAVVTGILLGATLILWARSGFATPPYIFMRGPAGMIAFSLAVSTQLVSGLVIAVRRPDLPVGRLALVFAFIIVLAALASAYIALAETGTRVPWSPGWMAWFPSWFSFGGASLTAIVLGLVFPDGQLPGRRWGAVLVLAPIGAVLTAIAMAFLPGPLVLFPTYDNPAAFDASMAGWLTAAGVVGIGFLVLGGMSVSLTLLIRYRRADELVRIQLRWYIAAAIALTVGFTTFMAALAVLPHDSPVGEAIMVAFITAGGLPPIALLVAVSRHRLYEIDSILSRAFVFGTLTAILAGLYTASIRLFNSIFVALTGEDSDATLVITTLVIAASFTPIKRRLEGLVEHRFHAPEADPASASPAEHTGPVPAVRAGLDDATVERLATAVLANPAFAVALDARIQAVAQQPRAPDAAAAEAARSGAEAARPVTEAES